LLTRTNTVHPAIIGPYEDARLAISLSATAVG
jgi:hypothetical protein